MADINFDEGDSDENSDAGEEGSLGVGSDGYDSDSSNPDSRLSPLQKLEKYMYSEHSYSRQMVARGLFETLKSLEESPEDEKKLFDAMVKLSSDPDSSVRAEIGEQITRMAEYFRTNPCNYLSVVSEYMVPILLIYFKDQSIPVRKSSENTMLMLVKDKLITEAEFESKVAPVILEMSEPESMDDFRTEAVVLMTKFAPMLDHDVTKRVFLTRFAQMCNDALFHVRKVCASNFGDMCQVVGPEITEKFLLPKFFYLCEDGVWGVRNACAECFMQVASICSPEVRRDELSMLFVRLLCDQSRWVRMAAFQALGGFISTFANPELTGLFLTEDGQLISREVSEQQFRKYVPASSTVDNNEVFQNNEHTASEVSHEQSKVECDADDSRQSSDATAESFADRGNPTPTRPVLGTEPTAVASTEPDSSRLSPDSTSLEQSESVASETRFDSFNYWRTAPTAVEKYDITSDGRLVDCTFETNLPCDDLPSSENSNESGVTSCTADECRSSAASENLSNADIPPSRNAKEIDNTHLNIESEDIRRRHGVTSTEVTSFASCGSESCFSGCADAISESDNLCLKQTIVPVELLEHFLSMAHSSRAQTVDAEIARHCAFSFPAVAYTLGRQNWPCLKELYETLARDMQWKVRRTLAFSIHELALILGESITRTDLLPIFDEFLKDLDEVRVGALKHMAEFLQLLPQDVRRKYLMKFSKFLETDNTRNWRFRMDLAEQLLHILDLFSPTDICEHLSPVAIALAEDRVAQVRLEALKVLRGIAKRLSLDVVNQLWSEFVLEISQRFAESNNWCRRQLFVYFCDGFLENEVVHEHQFVKDFLPLLVKLGSDHVPNIRLAVARTMHNVSHSEFFRRHSLPQLNELIECLKEDRDKDVRYAMTGSTLQTFSSSSVISDEESHQAMYDGGDIE